MRILSVLIVPALLAVAACSDSDDATSATKDKKEHFLSAQQKAMENAKAVAGAANEATARRQKELDKLNNK